MKPKILFILHLPPPVHGAAMVGKYIHDSKLINERFECQFINLALAKDLNDIGKGGIKKIKHFITKLQFIKQRVKEFSPNLCYVTPNAKGGAFYKDFIVVQLLKSMGCKVVVHFHNKGVSLRQKYWLDNFLYTRFFKDLKVILLSQSLYQDFNKYVSLKNVFICPNGIPQSPPLPQIPHSKFTILFLSNMIEEKGVWTLVEACKELKEKKNHLNAILWVNGVTLKKMYFYNVSKNTIWRIIYLPMVLNMEKKKINSGNNAIYLFFRPIIIMNPFQWYC